MAKLTFDLKLRRKIQWRSDKFTTGTSVVLALRGKWRLFRSSVPIDAERKHMLTYISTAHISNPIELIIQRGISDFTKVIDPLFNRCMGHICVQPYALVWIEKRMLSKIWDDFPYIYTCILIGESARPNESLIVAITYCSLLWFQFNYIIEQR